VKVSTGYDLLRIGTSGNDLLGSIKGTKKP
jgi:hypothetical protein